MPARNNRLSDRQIVEQMVLPAALNAIISAMRKRLAIASDDGTSPELDRVQLLLDKALKEPVEDMSPDRVSKIVRRSKRVTIDALAPLFEKHPLATQYLTMAYLVAELSQEDIIQVGAQSPFSEAWDIMVEVMDCVSDKLPEMDSIATVEAQNLRCRLRSLGYFT